MWARLFDSQFFTFFFPVLLLASVVAGYARARRYYRKQNREWRSSGAEAAVIGLFGLMLSFTFLSAGNAMRERNQYVHSLADATADLRRNSLLCADTLKADTRQFLLRFLEGMGRFGKDLSGHREAYLSEMAAISGAYLTQLTEHGRRGPESLAETRQLLPFFNQLNRHFYRLVYSYGERLPRLLLFLLTFSAVLIALLIGFMNQFQSGRQWLVPLIYIVLVSLSVQVIRDIDNPLRGTIRPGYNNFKQQFNTLQTSDR